MAARIRKAQGMDPDPDVGPINDGKFMAIAVPAEED